MGNKRILGVTPNARVPKAATARIVANTLVCLHFAAKFQSVFPCLKVKTEGVAVSVL